MIFYKYRGSLVIFPELLGKKTYGCIESVCFVWPAVICLKHTTLKLLMRKSGEVVTGSSRRTTSRRRLESRSNV